MIQKLNELIVRIRPELEPNMPEDFILNGVLDSLDIVLLVDEIDTELGIDFDVSQITPEVFQSIGSLANYLRNAK